jgi:Fe-S cluster biogenesis protein NfuA
MSQLLEVTEAALGMLLDALAPNLAGTPAVRASARLADTGVPAYKLAPMNGTDDSAPGDTVVTLAGLVVYVDPDSAPLLTGIRIDHVKTPRATGFVFRPSDAALTVRVEAALNEVRPRLQADGGDVELVEVRQARAVLAFKGSCVGCSMASMTLTRLLEQHLREAVPELTAVTAETVRSPELAAAAAETVRSPELAAATAETARSRVIPGEPMLQRPAEQM